MSESKTVAPTRAQFTPLNKVENLSQLLAHPDFKDRISKAAGSSVTPDRLLRTFALAVQKNPKLAQVSPMSFMGACITLAWLSLEPNTPLGLAHLIPFEIKKYNPQTRKRELLRTEINVIIGYAGYLDLIYNSEKVLEVHCDVVWKGDEFSYEYGSKRHLHHKPGRGTHAPDEMPEFAYAYAKFDRGGEDFLVMTLADVLTIRNRSQGYQSAMYAYDDAIKENKDPKKDKRYSESPWIKDFPAMMKKTPLRAAQKYWPRSVKVAAAGVIDGDAGRIDFSKITDVDMVVDGQFEHVDDDAPDQIEHDQTPKITVPTTDERQPTRVDAKTTASKPAATRTEASAARTTKAAPKATEPPSEPPEVQNAIYYPKLNEYGEEDDGPSGPSTDPVQFAQFFAERYAALSEAEREAYLEFNAETVGLARTNSEQAADILASVSVPGETKTLEITRKKTAAGGWDIKAYLAEAEQILAWVYSPDQLRDFVLINTENSAKLPPTAKVNFQKMVDAKRAEWATVEPAPPAEDEEMPFDDSPSQDAQPEPDQWDRFADGLRKDFTSAKSAHDLTALIRNAAVSAKLRDLKAARPDLAAMLDEEFEARKNQLKSET